MACSVWAGPTTKSVHRWKAPSNQKRLLPGWWTPAEKQVTPADGPFLLYVSDVASKVSAKLERDLFQNTAIVLSAHACPWVRISPNHAADLPYLKSLPRIADPMLVAVGKDARVIGVLDDKRKFTVKHCFDIVEKAAATRYETKLSNYVNAYVKILAGHERIFVEQKKLDALKRKNKIAAAELAVQRAKLAATRQKLRAEEAQLRASLGLKGDAPEETVADAPGLSADERNAIRAYRKLAKNRSPYVRATALEALRAPDTPALVKEILAAARTGDSWTVWRAGQVLARMNSEPSLKTIMAALERGGTRERVAALLSFETRDHPPAHEAILKLAGDRNRDKRTAALRALSAQRDKRAAAAILAALGDRDARIRTLAARCAGRAGLNATPLHDVLDDREWSVRKAALESLVRLGRKASVPHVLFRFQMETGVLRDTGHDARVRLTARTFFYDIDGWRKWWEDHRDAFQPPSPKLVERALDTVAGAGRNEPWRFTCEYHGLRTCSRRIFFLLDIGPSMDQQMNLPPNLTLAQRAELRSGSKLDLAKKELIRALKTLDHDDEFNILAFSGGVKTWRAEPARAAHRPAAIQFIKKLKTKKPSKRTADSVGTGSGPRANSAEVNAIPNRTRAGWIAPAGLEHRRNLYGALMTGMGVMNAQPFRDRSRPAVDTLFLVVDGAPSLGEVTEVPRIAEIIRELNLTRGVTIHVVTFESRNDNLYKILAEVTGGRHAVHGP